MSAVPVPVWLFVAFVLGVIFGLFIAALCAMASDGDDL